MMGGDYQAQLESWASANLRITGRGDWRNCRCPFHDDKTPSGRFNLTNAKFVCQACGKQCFADEMADELGLADAPPVKPEWAEKQAAHSQSQDRPYVDKAGFTQVESYLYRDSGGDIRSRVSRMEKLVDGKKRKKFPQSWPAGDGWGYKQPDGFQWILYGLPELSASNDSTVLFLEGEKDVHRARRAGFTATTTPMGAGAGKASMVNDWSVLQGKTVVVVEDNDEPGKAHALEVARLAKKRGQAASVKVLDLPGVGPGGDLSDWFAVGGTAEQLRDLIANCSPLTLSDSDLHPASSTGNGKRSIAPTNKTMAAAVPTEVIATFSDEEGAHETWGRPQPLNVSTLPPFDLSPFCPELREFGEALQRETETPASYVGTVFLGVLSAIMAGSMVVRVRGSWYSQSFVWVMSAGPPGSGKSPVLRPCVKPIISLQKLWAEQAAPRIRQAEAAREYQEMVLKKATDELRKDPQDELLRRACDTERERLATLPVVTTPRLLFNDSTTEAIVRQASENHGIGALISDEVGFLQKQQGNGGAGDSNIDPLLAGYEADPYMTDRIKRGRLDVPELRISLCALPQPGPLQKLIADERLRERGFVDRPLISQDDEITDKTFSAPSVPPELHERYRNFIEDLAIRYKGSDGTKAPTRMVVGLCSEGRKRIVDLQRRLQGHIGEGKRFDAIRGYISKTADKAVRLAALFYGCEHTPHEGAEIPVDYIDRAIGLIESHYLPHASKVFGIEPEEADIIDARKIVSKAIAKGMQSETLDRIRRATRIPSENLNAALSLLEAYGWAKEIQEGTKGRPRSRFIFHPEAAEHFQDASLSPATSPDIDKAPQSGNDYDPEELLELPI